MKVQKSNSKESPDAQSGHLERESRSWPEALANLKVHGLQDRDLLSLHLKVFVRLNPVEKDGNHQEHAICGQLSIRRSSVCIATNSHAPAIFQPESSQSIATPTRGFLPYSLHPPRKREEINFL